MSAAAPLGLTIYDRQHDDPESPYKYPGGLGGYVAGSLSYEEMIQAYKAHPVQINVNSVLDSRPCSRAAWWKPPPAARR